ncbi:hypothetical protein AB832_02615 [Flavobacteriaceae bacterium (ex Bugula neritina AB1)]|nr:hypothetical protein AB832_02615 [Flavobacteriaceae bacterium (ex Bugula neritina AB1)]
MKKILGILFIIMGAILSLVILADIPKTMGLIANAIQNNQIEHWGFLAGSIFMTFVFVAVAFFLFRFGIKFIKK